MWTSEASFTAISGMITLNWNDYINVNQLRRKKNSAKIVSSLFTNFMLNSFKEWDQNFYLHLEVLGGDGGRGCDGSLGGRGLGRR